MLKKVCIFCLFFVFSCTICLSSCSSHEQADADVLSAEEIATLRKQYPIYTNVPPTTTRANISFKSILTSCLTATLVEITSTLPGIIPSPFPAHCRSSWRKNGRIWILSTAPISLNTRLWFWRMQPTSSSREM